MRQIKSGKSSPLLAMLTVLGLLIFLPMTPVSGQEENKPGWLEWGEKYWPTKPVRGGIFQAAAPYYIGVMNPNHFPVMDWVTISHLYDKLIIHDARYKPTIPWLAESWTYLDDRTMLMKLRKGVRFHDGSEFNAAGLKYQMEWILDKNNGAWSRTWLEPLEAVEVVDPHTVKWHFKRPWGAFLGTMASVPGYMISPKALKADWALSELQRLKRRMGSLKRKAEETREQVEKSSDKDEAEKGRLEQEAREAALTASEAESRLQELEKLAEGAKPLDAYPVGTGPYMLEKNSPGNYVQLTRNPDWWFGKSVGMPEMPYYDGLKVAVIPDPSVRLAGLKAGQLDLAIINPTQYKLVENDPKLKGAIGPLNWLVWLMLNQNGGPCKDIRVRKAISHAIDRKALIMGTQNGLGREASCIFPDSHWTHNPDLQPIAYDPELSKRLLAEAGYAGGLTLRGFTSNEPVSQAFAKAVMAMLEKVGIKWDCKLLGIAAMAEPFTKRDYDMAGGLYQWIFEPDHIATALYMPDGVLNYERNHNEKAMELIRRGREEMNEDRRRAIYQELERVLYENYEDVWLWYPMMVTGANARIEGVNVDMLKAYGEGYVRSHPTWFKDGSR